jgi:hypothetical protein
MTEKANLITINGSEFTFQPGETIHDVARRNAGSLKLEGEDGKGRCWIATRDAG